MLRAHEPTMPSDGWVPNNTKAPHEPQQPAYGSTTRVFTFRRCWPAPAEERTADHLPLHREWHDACATAWSRGTSRRKDWSAPAPVSGPPLECRACEALLLWQGCW